MAPEGGVVLRIIWLDVETTGLDRVRNGIIQIAGIVEIGGEAVESFNLSMNPVKEIDAGAEAIHGISSAEIAGYPAREETYRSFTALLDQHVDVARPETRLKPGGYNVSFDLGFLEQWFLEMGGASIYAYLTRDTIDPSAMMKAYQGYLGKKRLPSWGLRGVASRLGVDLGRNHDALEDIRFTRELHRRLLAFFDTGAEDTADQNTAADDTAREDTASEDTAAG